MSSLSNLQPLIRQYLRLKLGKVSEPGVSIYALAEQALAGEGHLRPEGIQQRDWLKRSADLMLATVSTPEAREALRDHTLAQTERTRRVTSGTKGASPAHSDSGSPGPLSAAVTLCRFCGEPIRFTTSGSGANVPVNPDGRDHRETCALMPKTHRAARRDENHEARVADFLRAPQNPKWQPPVPAAPSPSVNVLIPRV